MIDLYAGLRSQLKELREKLKKHNPAKNPKVYKEILDALEAGEARYAKETAKREEKRKAKELRTEEVAKEAAPKVEEGNVIMPKKEFVDEHEKLVKELEPMVEEHKDQGAELVEVKKEATPTCAHCGGVTFKSYPEYKSHMEQVHAPKKEYSPMDLNQKREVVKDVEHKFGPAIISEQEDEAKLNKKIQFQLDQIVKPVRGSESKGRVMRHDSPEDLVYIFWDDGVLKDRDVAGGYYPNEIVAVEEPKEVKAEESKSCPSCDIGTMVKENGQWHCPECMYVLPVREKQAEGNPPPPDTSIVPKEEPKCPCYEDMSVYCPKCKTNKTSDLKSNYEALLKDLKEERDLHYQQGNQKWVERLEGKIKDLEQAIAEKFGNEKQGSEYDTKSRNDFIKEQIEHTRELQRKAPTEEIKREFDSKIKRWEDLLSNKKTSNFEGKCDLCKGPVCERCKQCHNCVKINGSMGKECGAQNNSEGLVVLDHNPPRANTSADEIGTDSHDEFQDEWSEPKVSSINVFNKNWSAKATKKAGKLSYEISDESGKKILSLSPLNGKTMNAEHLKWACEKELVKGYKKAELVDKISFLDKGTKVYVLAQDKAKKRVKIASLEHNVRAWISESSLKIEALESQAVSYNGQSCKVLGATSTQTLIDSPTEGPVWVNSTELLDANRPPATPEALNEQPIEEEAAKDCPDCHGNFVGKENDKCPTCGRFSVTALKTALPSVIPNQRGYLDNPPPVEKKAGPNCAVCGVSFPNFTEYTKHKEEKHSHPKPVKCSDCGHSFETVNELEQHKRTEHKASLNKVAHIKHEDGKWVVYSHDYSKKLGTYPTKEKALKRLRQIEFYKRQGNKVRPFSKKAEVMTDPYQALISQVESMRGRMADVQQRLESSPLPKVAGADEKDNSEIDLSTLFEDLTMGIDLIESKAKDAMTPELHENLESLENLLWEAEMKLGLTPKLSEDEKAEPEHKEIVEEVEASEKGRKPRSLVHKEYKDELTKEELEDESVEKEAALPVAIPPVLGTTPAPAANATPTTTPDDQKTSCALCGGISFPDFAAYQQHMEYTHASDTMPTSPTQKNLPTVAASKKIAVDVQVTDETIEEGFGAPPPVAAPITPAPVIKNVQPTDDDNLDVPVVAPTSPTPPGTQWVFDTQFNKYVIMPNSNEPGKTI